jgi:hypothetical protein
MAGSPQRREPRVSRRNYVALFLLAGFIVNASGAISQDQGARDAGHATDSHAAMPGMDMAEPNYGAGSSSASELFMEESSGTAVQPAAWPMPMTMTSAGSWNLMWMGQAFLVDTQQTGPLGADKLYSTNWGMLGATHRLGGGSVMLRTMLSLEPATITERRYPCFSRPAKLPLGIQSRTPSIRTILLWS